MGSGEVAIVALSTMISLKVTFSDGLGGGKAKPCLTLSLGQDLESRVQTCNEALR